MRSSVRFVPLVVAAIFAALFFAGLFLGDPSRLPSAYEGKLLPAFELPQLGKNEPLTHHMLATGSPVLVNIWASWCAPCRQEHPALMHLADQGVAIFGLNYKDNLPAARRFLGRLGNPYRAIGVDKNGQVALDMGVYGVPETFLLDGEGRVVLRHVGALTEDVLTTKILPYFSSRGKPR